VLPSWGAAVGSAPAWKRVTERHICEESRPDGTDRLLSGQLVGQAGAGNPDGHVNYKARMAARSGWSHVEVTDAEPGGPPDRSTAATLTDQIAEAKGVAA
jgi:hypothetical protein